MLIIVIPTVHISVGGICTCHKTGHLAQTVALPHIRP